VRPVGRRRDRSYVDFTASQKDLTMFRPLFFSIILPPFLDAKPLLITRRNPREKHDGSLRALRECLVIAVADVAFLDKFNDQFTRMTL